jgi:hypothetical protein
MERRQWKGGQGMIESVDRIVTTPMRECPPFVEGILGENSKGVLHTRWFAIEPLEDDWFLVTDTWGNTMQSRGSAMVKWLKPEDKNDPVIQAELITGLASMGMEL